MNGVHDMGGMDGFGAVDAEDDAQFHADWERLVFAMDKIAKAEGRFNIDEKRHAIERMPPADYLGSTYFERWLDALERLHVEKGLLTETDIAEARADVDAADLDLDLEGDASTTDDDIAGSVREAFESDAAFDREPREPRFESGAEVVVANMHPAGHTRCPRYVRGVRGTVADVHGTYALPDASAHGEEDAEPLYSVRFDAADLWGADREADDAVHVDLWESYLEEP
jgi:nitrile hydratase